MSGHGAAINWAEYCRLHARPDWAFFSLWHVLNPENLQDIQICIRFSSFLEVIPDFPALAPLCQQQGFYAGILRQELRHREIELFGYELAHHRQTLRRIRLEFLREVWAIDRQLRSHRTFIERYRHGCLKPRNEQSNQFRKKPLLRRKTSLEGKWNPQSRILDCKTS